MEKKQTDTEIQRNSNAEILRIIAMLMIVASHYSFHGMGASCQPENIVNFLFLKMVTLGNLGVNIFVLLFGYFSVSKERFDWRRGFLLWFQVFTYSVLIFMGLFLSGVIEFSFSACLQSLFPAVFSNYWFFTAYIVFYLLTPFLNKMLKMLSYREYRILLVTILVIWCVIPTLTARAPAGDDFALFFLLYTLGGYFKLYPENRWNSKKSGELLACASAVLLFGSSVMFFLLRRVHPVFSGRETFFYHKNSALVICFALGLLIIAVNSKPRYFGVLNQISACTFGIYLLHDNDLIREFIWHDLFQVQTMAESAFLIVHCLAAVAAVFLVGILAESVRKLTLERIGIYCCERIEKTIKSKR